MVSMGKGRPRSVEKGVLGPTSTVLKSGSLNIPPGPVYYPTEEEFKDPLEFIYKIRPEAEQYGICRIVPPKSWKPPFALDLDSFTFPTKTQAIHQLQARPAACDSKTFELEYNRFLENHGGKRSKKRVIFEGEELDLCKLFNAAKRFGGYDKVVKEKKWGEVFRFVKLGKKISECAKHVLCQLYREHLYDYETYYNSLNHETAKSCQGGTHVDNKSDQRFEVLGSKRRRKNQDNEKVKVIKVEKEEELDQICEQCRSGQHGEVMLLCDRCNKGWHIYCLSPPLKQIPPGNWYCLECLNSDKDSFGFVPGKRFSLESFRRMADRAKRKWFGSASASRVQIEKKFWEIVEGLLGEVEVKYGSDLDASVYGSGFPRLNDQRPQSIEAGEWDEYCASPWNLNNLPKLPGSVLQAVHHSIAGVMVPWVYIGMLFSSFCWHFEDHCFYSMNYLHWGEPKCWYSVPGSKASAFEKVMRNSLPDLFDAQPDLLFQLVTMLNPSVLQDNGVPVFSVLQEPGNFVITFPRSYHGGFNFGLNCAEAVNFAPADWLPHGGFGAELYQLYRKVAVLSHEELLCVVAKSNCDSKISPYLKKELLRIYAKEKTWRERLWRNGIVNSSPMSPRKHPEYVGPEEDPTCIICQQYLYLSAVVCRCRPSAFVCLEHWKHLCECKPSKHRLLYRYTLADLNLLVLMTDKNDFQETRQNKNFGRKLSCSDDLSSVTKKVKGGHVSLPQLAEEWLLRTCKIFETPYSSEVYVKALKEAEQFLWAGSEMDPVRDVAKNLSEGEKWAESVRSCLSRVQKWSSHHCNDLEKVSFEHVDRLLNLDPVPCNEPGHLKLKDYAEEARVLIREIDSALSKCSKLSIPELEILYFRAADLPIYVKEIEKLGQKISSVKVWVDSVRECVSEKCPAAIDVDLLYKLKSESVELQVQLPEAAMLFDLLMRAESCRSRCNDILTGSITLKNVGVLLQEFDSFTVNIFELKLLRQYHSDAISWLSRFKDVLVNIHEREDQEIVVVELNCILKDGASLKIQVDEFSLLEVEVKKACLRGKALKARATKMPMDFIQQLVKEAVILQIDGEKLFVDISRALAAALRWEERARHILASEAPMSDFEDAIRDSENTCAVLPLLDDVKNAVSVAKSWLKNCKPILDNYFSEEPAASRPLLEIQALKELSSQLGLLKISMEERLMLQTVVNSCKEWEHVACSALQDVDSLFNMDAIGTRITSCIILKIGSLVTRVESITKAGLSLGFDFPEIKKLQEAGSSLHWCNKALSFCSVVPPLEDIQSLIEVSDRFPVSWASGVLCSSLINGVKWIKRASEIIPVSCNHTKFELSAVEKILGEYQRIDVSFPAIVDQLVNAIEKHKSWQDQVHMFFSLKPGERSWSQLVHIKELGMADAFKCCELDRVFSEVEKVEKWKRHCDDIVGSSVADANPLLGALLMIKRTLDNSLCIYDMSRGCKAGDLCLGCFHDLEDREFLTCSTCKDCYHFQCLGPILADVILYTCPYCKFMESGSVSWKGCNSLRFGGRCPELKMLLDLLSESESLFVWTEEREVLQEVVERALACKAFITKIVDYSLAYFDRDLTIISKKLTNALKAVDVSGVHDRESNVNLDLALARNAWRFRTNKLLEGSKKPLIQQIQRYSKEGLAIGIPREDHYWKKLTELKQIGLEWADIAKKVSMDSGALELDKVFKLITEGENLPVHFDKELKLLRDRSMLYCICRKPYDQRDMIACDQCDEWYHFDCIKLSSPPKIYICPACKPESEYGLSMSPVANQESAKFGEPQTPSPRNTEPRREAKEVKLRSLKHLTQSSILRASSGMDTLLWSNRKPFRRLSKKRVELESLSPFFNIQEQT